MRERWRRSFQSLVPRGRRRRTAGRRQQAVTPVAVPEAQGEVGGRRALPGREAVAGLRFGTPAGAEAQLRVSEGSISNESRVRKLLNDRPRKALGCRTPTESFRAG